MSVVLGPVDLVCPRDRSPLDVVDGALVCKEQHAYRVTSDIPVLLLRDERPTHPIFATSLDQEDLEPFDDATIDPRIQAAISSTCGYLYEPLIGRMSSYPIPRLRLPPGDGRRFLEIGCHWGRWCVAAARQGYRAVGIDPSLLGIGAARSIARHLDVDASYAIADSRHLPFEDGTFDVVFSYSVFQHLSKDDVLASFDEIARVLAPNGIAMLQFANVWGLRSLMNQARERRFREPREVFDVRYWRPSELKHELERRVGATQLSVDGFFTLNPQPSDLDLLPFRFRAVVRASEALRKASGVFPPLVRVADSLYAVSRRASAS